MLIITALIANSIAHIISYLQLNRAKAPNSMGVLAFVFINAIIAILIWQNHSWSKWLALIFPLIGGSGLLITTITKGTGKWIDYVILLLDIAIITLVLKNYFL